VPQKLPEILSREEVWRLIDAASSPKHRLLLATTYAAGLRVSEVVALKVSDIDPERLTIRVEQGKGGKDRYVPLADRLLVELRRYWRGVPPAHWVFPNRQGTRPIDITVAQKIYMLTKLRAGIRKQGGIHTLPMRTPPTCWRRGRICTPSSAFSATARSPPPCATST
jgi:integrase/recombinase XerD